MRIQESCTSQSCPLCGSSATEVEFVKEEGPRKWSLGRCQRCGLHFTDPRPTHEYLAECYSGDFHKDLRTEEGTEKAFGAKFRRYADWLASQLPAGSRVLDIGCSTGGLVKLLRDRGFAAEGLELNPETAAWGSAHYGITIHNKTFEDCNFAPETFDAVILADVLEHTLHPRDYLAHVGETLSPHGLVLVTFPDIHSIESRYYKLMAKLTRRPWIWRTLHIPLHIWEFTRATATACFEGAGFEIIAFRRDQVVDPENGSLLLRLITLPTVVLAWPVICSLLGTQMEFLIRKK
jgi:SAM-dependent methyltransferase